MGMVTSEEWENLANDLYGLPVFDETVRTVVAVILR